MIDQKLDNPRPVRFAESLLHRNPEASIIKHFTPLSLELETNTKVRDRFGNRIINSHDKAYFDKVGNETKVALLISPEGEAFIKNNKGILNDIDRGLEELHGEIEEKRKINFGNGRRMELLKIGGQSQVFVLFVGTEKCIVTKKTPYVKDNDISQPYINEMLQCQTLAEDLKQELDKIGAIMPTFLFASGQMACRKYEDGRELKRGEFDKEIQQLVPVINEYLQNFQKNGSVLWKNIKPDMFWQFRPNEPFHPNDHWFKREDGKYACIDPFFFDEKTLAKGK